MTTQRLAFSRWTAEDTDLARQLWGDATVSRFLSTSGGFTPAQIAQRLQTEIDNDRAYGVQYWPVFLRETGAFAGCCGLRPYDVPNGVYEFGIHLLPACWGQGLATEAGQAVLRYAFGTLRAASLFAGHHPENTASRAMLGKLGFAYDADQFYAPTGLMHPSYTYRPEKTS